MKAVLTLLIACTTAFAYSQNIVLSLDSVKANLCKKWEVHYATMGNTKIDRLPGATGINYEFSRNGTFVTTGDDPKEITKGTWKYDTSGKRITLNEKGRESAQVIALNNRELILKLIDKQVVSQEMEIKLIFRPATNESTTTQKKQIKAGKFEVRNLAMKDPHSKTVFVGAENIVEVVGPQGMLIFEVTGAGAILKRLGETKVAIIPSGEGKLTLTVMQNGKILTEESFTAVVTSN